MLSKNCTELPLGLFVCLLLWLCWHNVQAYNPQWITLTFWLEIASHATLPWIFPLKKANGAQKIFGLRIFSSDLEISEAFMMSHEVSFFFFSFVSDSKIMHISVLFFSNKGLSILASTGFYHSSPLLFLIVFSLTHSPSMMLWENKGPVDCLFFVKFWTEWTRCINSYYCCTLFQF